MGRVAVVTDSSACLPGDLVSELDVHVVPLRFSIDGESYRDGIDITATDLYRLLPRVRELPTTSAPTPSDYYAAYQQVAADHDSVVVITLARRFSGMHQSALLAAATAEESLPGLRIEVVDSGTAAGAEGLVALSAARRAAAGAALDDVISAAREVSGSVVLVATLDTLYYLARGGRVPMAVHWANSVVRVNPVFRILPMSADARTVRVARGRQSAVRQMLELVRQQVGAGEWHGIVFHSDSLDDAEELRCQVGRVMHVAELYLCDFTPAMGIHTGPGVLGLAYYTTG
jgi:DegV family protein with EDD domain